MEFVNILFLLPILMLMMVLFASTIANMIKFTYIAIRDRDYDFLLQALFLTIVPILIVWIVDT